MFVPCALFHVTHPQNYHGNSVKTCNDESVFKHIIKQVMKNYYYKTTITIIFGIISIHSASMHHQEFAKTKTEKPIFLNSYWH